MSGNSFLEAAADVARLAGDIALRHFGAGVMVEWKQDGSPVTVADRDAERAARDWIEKRFPTHGILGEEHGEIRPGAEYRWVIDPIDGTKTFVRGVPLWGTLVAVATGERVVAGAAYFPAVNEIIGAAPGEGCWWNGRRCAVSQVETLGQATVLTTDERFTKTPERAEPWRALARRSAVARSWGDCYGYLLVATGRAEVMTDGIVGAWDTAPLLPIVEEAGGVFTDWKGRVTAFGGSAIATNAALAGEVRQILGAGDGP
ncbi:MAG TPA: histidinol-phosphatase [Gemmatimonadaceae bacterium]|nr:histidinol-phosphatase [Gemmatimonadaceae bacterium]